MPSRVEVLNERQKDILYAVADGKKKEVIAGELNISVRTVKWHWSNILKIAQSQDTVSALRYFFNFTERQL